ncbi:MAG: DNA repair protein RecO [Syntrophobacterales bacterium]|nr:MAG: DNA repair protein RecO [Syntrophobacterales bacterium]
MVQCKTWAIVIKTLDYGESDRIVTFYTSDFGKVKGFAKGAKKSKRRFSNALELFTLNRLIFFDKKESGLVRIEGCDIVNAFPAIREDVRKIAFGCYLVELVDEMTGEREANPDLFDLLKVFLSLLSDGDGEAQILRIFEIRLLSLLGYRPWLDRCLRCNETLEHSVKVHFSVKKGGLLCERCSRGYMDLIPVSLGTAKLLHVAIEMDLSKIHRLKFSKQALGEGEAILSKFIQYHTNRELKSKKFLKDLGM